MKIQQMICLSSILLSAYCANNVIAQNLVSNPTFDIDLAGWDALAGSAEWDPLDAGGSPDSGSALITGSGPGGSLSQVLVQCIPVLPAWHYVFGSRAFIPSGMPASTYAFVKMNWYSDSLCTELVAVGGSTSLFDTEIWAEIFGTQQVPDGASYVRIALSVGKDTDDPAASLHHDDVYLTPITIFIDGFETGGTQAWSATVP